VSDWNAPEGRWHTPEDDTLRIKPDSRRNLKAYVWYCGDDYCNCRMLTIQAQFTHLLGPWNPWYDIWSGEFQTDGESFTPEGIAGWKAACAEVGLPEPTECDWMVKS
jgi:hypothetical protein